ncbi:TonB-dependent receptor [Flagellimonas amoyensis]|uniref:TonB-dependent receptor n=1 Tax=Flagellimonas amoyensis TaxID=2169401 RepID=UPI000D3A3919|nr:TonB-dependent receptor [Allomuricauda amoyensis]
MKNKIYLLVYFPFLWTTLVNAQQELRGTVYDASTSEPLVGATLVVQNTQNGTVTDFEGSFRLEHTENYPITIEVSYLGYETKEFRLAAPQVLEIYLTPSSTSLNEIIVTSRRRSEAVQEIPIPIAVIGAREIDNSVSFNVNRVKELVPSVQLYSSNPRNTTLNIRGMGSTFGLTNDGIDPGAGFYVDGVYYARPAATTLDFIDTKQIEVLRGPQGTLFGKNTTAGTFNITTRRPTFTNTLNFEQSFGNYGFIQTKGSLSGPLVGNKLAARLSFSGTHRDGTIYNQRTEKYTNTLNNQGLRGQLFYLPSEGISILLSADYTRQRPDGYAQVYAGTAPTLRADFRQFENIIADLGYDLPSRNPFDRVIDHDTPWNSDQDFGGVSLNADIALGKGTLTSTTAWRSWKWAPSNDRDFTGLSAISRSQAPSIHHQYSQEFRYAGEFSERLDGTLGLFAFYQKLDAIGAHILEAGSDQWRFVQNNQDPLWETPGLLDGLTQETRPSFRNFSGALFGQLDWSFADKWSLLPGFRINYDQKEVDFENTVTGGLQTDDPALIALQNRVFTPMSFQTDIDDWNLSGQLTLSHILHENFRVYGTYSLGFKPVGLNLGGIPTEDGVPLLELAVVKPEKVDHFELGLKSEPFKNAIFNLTAFRTDIKDYQTNVQSAQLGVTRGYLANAEKVRVQGLELEVFYDLPQYFRFNAGVSYTDGTYVSFTNAPVPLEETGGEDYKDISGEVLPGISKWTVTTGTEIHGGGNLFGEKGEFFLGADLYARSSFSSSPSASRYLNIDGYTLVNGRLGFRGNKSFSVFIWAKNLFNKDYFEQLLPAGGNAGHYAGVLGDPATYGITTQFKLF